MKIDKTELAKKIAQLQSVVPKKSPIDALQGVLVCDGWLIAANSELTVKAKLEGIEDETFIIPAKAFDLIKNLPAGEVSVSCSNNEVTIQTGNIKNRFKTFSVDDFAYTRKGIDTGEESALSADKMKKAISRVLYAISSGGVAPLMTGMFLSCHGGILDFAGLDGHRIAWDRMAHDGEFDLIIPKPALEKIVQLDLQGDVRISYDANGAVFATEDFEVYTRLIQGEFYKFKQMFDEGSIFTVADRRRFLDSLNRAQLCGSAEDKAPVVLEIGGNVIRIQYKNTLADYEEELITQSETEESLRIGFNPRLLIECLKSFDCDNVSISFSSAKMPAIIKAEDSDLTALVLPVKIKS